MTSDDVIVSVLGSFIHLESPMSPDVIQIVPLLMSNLMSLIGKKVLHAEANKDGKLSLHFDNGHILTLLDDLKQYESYIIQINNKEIVV